MVGVAGVHQRQSGSVEEDPVEVLEIDVLSRLAAVPLEVEKALVLVDLYDLAGAKGTRGDGVLELTIDVVEIEVAPPAALRPPDHLVAFLQVAHALGSDVCTDETILEKDLALSCADVDGAEFDVSQQAVTSEKAQLVPRAGYVRLHIAIIGVGVGSWSSGPVKVLVTLVFPFPLDREELFPVAIEDVNLAGCDLFLPW